MILAAVLAVLMGGVLGLLGGGGSVLTVPILVYGLGVPTKEAVASSLVIVALTAAFGAVQQVRSGNVVWRIALVFSGFAMLGAFAGGRLAAFVPGPVILALFALLMVGSGVAMLVRGAPKSAPGGLRLGKVALEATAVGAVTGLVGAGGGFLVVPALVLLGGLDARRAVGTSLVVVALKSGAGFLGHAGHTSIDWALVLTMSGMAVVGAFAGGALAQRVRPAVLQRVFAIFLLVMATFILGRELPVDVVRRVFETRWPFWVGGGAIAGFVVLFLLVDRKTLGISSGFEDVCGAPFDASVRKSWRLPFLGGIVLGGALAALLSGGFELTWATGAMGALVPSSGLVKAAVFTGGGVLVGFGARLAGGCTSGHGIVGMAQLAPASVVSTVAFMVAGFAVTQLLLASGGG